MAHPIALANRRFFALALLAASCNLAAQPGATESSAWIQDRQAESTGQVSITLEASSRPLVYGRVVDAVIEVANGTQTDRQVVIKALLGEVAHFVGSDSGARFENPEQAAQERRLEWPALGLPAGARGRLSFQFLVTWDASGDVYLQIDAEDSEGVQLASTYLRETPRYPSGGGGLAQYGYLLVTVVLFALLLVGVHRARRQISDGKGIAASLSGICLGCGAVLLLMSGNVAWNDFEPWFGWKATTCQILDVRYSLDTSTTSNRSGPSTTHRFYSGSLTLGFEGPDGPMISSGYRKQSSISRPEILNAYRAGTEADCYYDPGDPGWVIVERGLKFSSLLWEAVFAAAGLLLIGFGWRARITGVGPS